MEFKNMAIGEYSYGDEENPEILEEMEKIAHVDFTDLTFFEKFRNKSSKEYPLLKKYLFHLALCHTIIAEEKMNTETNKIELHYNVKILIYLFN